MSDFDKFPGQNCACGNDPNCYNCGSAEAFEQQIQYEQEKKQYENWLYEQQFIKNGLDNAEEEKSSF